jgi:hypothetical protein
MDGYAKKHLERLAAQELVKEYGVPGSTEGVLGQPHYSSRYGRHQDLYSINKGSNGKLGEPVVDHLPYTPGGSS